MVSGDLQPSDGDGPPRRPVERVYDQAAQLERTALAWNRTLLAFAVNGALLVRIAEGSRMWVAIAGFLIMAVTLPAWVITNRAYRQRRGGPAASLLARGSFTVGVAALIVVVGVVDLLAILTHP
jgi:uncharacterized membrane protein YidH (DUF202 family)